MEQPNTVTVELDDFGQKFLNLINTKQIMLPSTVLRVGSIPAWTKHLAPYKDVITDGLEIGSFEGSSTMFWLEFFPKIHMTCIDPFTGNPKEHLEPLDGKENPMKRFFVNCEARFHVNLSPYYGRYTCLKATSQEALPLIRNQFGLIYVDGLHEEAGVAYDTEKCWDLCRVNGLLLWDDYDTEIYPGNKHTLRKVIDKFLKTKKDQWLEVFNSTQCYCIQKIS